MAIQAKKAIRKKIYAKLALMAPSGGGKTYSALRLATGMAEELEKINGKKGTILLVNTEGERGYYYADEFEYDIVDIEEPYEPEKFIEAIEYGEKEKYDIIIMDSTSHEWEGKGGCLEIQQRLGGRYQDWAKVTPRHDKFINAMAGAEAFIIATMRGKDQYVMSQDDKNKTKVEKVGVGAKQRDGFEYEFTCTFMLDQKTNTAEPFKDNTHIFENEPNVKLTEEHGRRVIRWANSSNIAPEKKKPATKSSASGEDLKAILEKIDAKAQELKAEHRDELISAIKSIHTSANYNTVKDVETAKKILEALNKIN